MEPNPEASPLGQPATPNSPPELPDPKPDPKPDTPISPDPKPSNPIPISDPDPNSDPIPVSDPNPNSDPNPDSDPKPANPNPDSDPSPEKRKPESDPKPDRPKKKKAKKASSISPEKVNGGENPNISVSAENTPDTNNNNNNNQLVVYEPSSESQAIVPAGAPSANRVLPSIGAFTVQCAACFKWRLIPTKEKYEAIRERILQDPFVCERATEWREGVSCSDKEDISQDGSRLWAIDKPNIAQPPKGWDRLIHIRGEGSTRFADVYYAAPNGKKLRSMVEIEKYLNENAEYKAQGVTLSQFSFQIPRPLHDNYVKKRVPKPVTPSSDTPLITPGPPASAPDLSKPLDLEDVNPIAWAPPPTSSDPVPPPVTSVDQVDPVKPVNTPVKRKIIVKPPSREKNLSPSPARAGPTLAPCSNQSEVQVTSASPSGEQI